MIYLGRKRWLYSTKMSHETKCPMRHFVSWGTFASDTFFCSTIVTDLEIRENVTLGFFWERHWMAPWGAVSLVGWASHTNELAWGFTCIKGHGLSGFYVQISVRLHPNLFSFASISLSVFLMALSLLAWTVAIFYWSLKLKSKIGIDLPWADWFFHTTACSCSMTLNIFHHRLTSQIYLNIRQIDFWCIRTKSHHQIRRIPVLRWGFN